MLRIIQPLTSAGPREWIFGVLLREHLGLDYSVESRDIPVVRIEAEGRALEIPDTFFSLAEHAWLEPKTLPITPLEQLDSNTIPLKPQLTSNRLPVIFGDSSIAVSEKHIRLGVDVFGSAFLMLSRYEEAVIQERDVHDRFPASASLAFKEGFLERPIIDEYVELLWSAMTYLWPGLKRKVQAYKVQLSHDVDVPFAVRGERASKALRRFGGDIVVRRSASTAMRRLAAMCSAEGLRERLDPNNTFSWLMDQAERHGHTSSFFFMACAPGKYDRGYDIFSAPIRGVLRAIEDRGHEIGIHPSYRSYEDYVALQSEVSGFRRAMGEAGIPERGIGGRQHYLRWNPCQTWKDWGRAGLSYDSSVGFADQVGFRAGTGRDYTAFDLSTRSALKLRERPLVIMERTMLSSGYMGMSEDSAIRQVASLAERSKRVRGSLNLLWHNDQVITPRQRRCYQAVLNVL